MKKAIAVMEINKVRTLFNLPDEVTIADIRMPFYKSDTIEFKIHGAGWETPEGETIMRAAPATITRKENGMIEIDWNLPADGDK